MLLLLGQEASAAGDSPNLQWGRPQQATRVATQVATQVPAQRVTPRSSSKLQAQTATQPATQPATHRPSASVVRKTYVRRDSHVMLAAWDDDDAADRSVVVQRSEQDPFDDPYGNDPYGNGPNDNDRLAQLSDDPFDGPVDELGDELAEESLPSPELEADLNADDYNTVEEAIEEEIDRRQSADDLFDERMEDPLSDPYGDDLDSNPLLDDPDEDDGRLQTGEEGSKLPELDLDTDDSDDEDTYDEDDEYSDEEDDEDNAEAGDGLTPEELEEQRKELAKERKESEDSCQEKISAMQANRISSIDLGIRVDGNAGEDYPYECPVSSQAHLPRQWPQITYTWKASGLCHKPLYFEQVQLERYGHSWGPYVQPLMSGVHFFGTLPILPYKMGIRTPNECVYALGYYRPGNCAPYMIDPVPFTWRAAFFEGAAVTGISFIIP